MSEQQQAYCHHRHSRYHTVYCQMVFAVGLGGGQQFVKRDEDHNTCYYAEYYSENIVVEKWGEYGIAYQSPQRLGKPRQEREPEGFFSVARGIEHRNGDRYPFGNVVYGNSKCYGDSYVDVFQPCEGCFADVWS